MKLPFFGKDNHDDGVETETIAIVRINAFLVQIAICNIDSHRNLQLLSASEFRRWDGQSVESLISEIDSLLVQVMSLIPDDVDEPTKVLYGIPSMWVNDGVPLDKYKDWLKLCSSELELKPIGYAITTDAVINYLNVSESVSLTALLVSVDEDLLEVSLIHQGKVQQVEVVSDGNSILEKIELGIKNLPETQLPARIILFDGGRDLSGVWEKLNNYDWESADWGFLHLPKVDLIPPDLPIKGLLTAAGQAMGSKNPVVVSSYFPKSNVNVSDENMSQAVDEVDKDENQFVSNETGHGVDENISDFNVEDEVHKQISEVNEDVENLNLEKDDHMVEIESPVEGFVLGKDILEIDNVEISNSVDDLNQNLGVSQKSTFVGNDSYRVSHSSDRDQTDYPNSKVINSVGFGFRFPWKILLVLLFIGVIAAGGGYFWVNSLEAKILLLVEPDLLVNEFNLTVDPDAETVDFENAVMPGEKLSVEVEGVKSNSTSGTTLVGEKASGEIVIFNDTEASKILNAGIVITSEEQGLAFTLNDDVQIASKSVDLSADTPFIPGKVTVGVTAEEIGAEYNISSNSLFTIENFSQASLLAKNNSPFTGGSSREVQAVSQEDLDTLVSELKSELEEQAVSKLNQTLSDGMELIESSISIEVMNEEYDQNVGDQVDAVSLNLTLRFSGVAYSKLELDNQIKEQLVSRVPDNKELSSVFDTNFNLQRQVNDEDEGSDLYLFEVVTESYLLPKLNPDNIKNKIKGKRPAVVEDYLSSLPSVNQAKYELKPNLPDQLQFLSWYPFDESAIEVEIIPEEK